ncbi:RICIN domain-containing protein [Lentzea sp. E54]|uniref:RICIN domain-containing protein n=1 Tax=Lentzea xerophila TaxID=3435883 RepID=UPI003DA56CFD
MRIGRIAALLAVITATVGLAPPAQAAETWLLKNQWNNGCLDYNPTNGVHTRACNGGPWQQWQFIRYGDGTIRFLNVATKMCLDASEKGVRGWGCNELPYQRWRLEWLSTGDFRLFSRWDNRCLDNSEKGVRTWGCNVLPYQRWYQVETPL